MKILKKELYAYHCARPILKQKANFFVYDFVIVLGRINSLKHVYPAGSSLFWNNFGNEDSLTVTKTLLESLHVYAPGWII